jgi:hypothetical protein
MVEEKFKMYSRNKNRLTGAVCRHILEHHGKSNKELAVLREAVEKTITVFINKTGSLGVETLIAFDPKKESSVHLIKELSNKTHIEYSKIIKEKHTHLHKPAKVKPHTRARIH